MPYFVKKFFSGNGDDPLVTQINKYLNKYNGKHHFRLINVSYATVVGSFHSVDECLLAYEADEECYNWRDD